MPYAAIEEAQANQFYQEQEATAQGDVEQAADLLTEEEINEEFRIASNEEREATAAATEFKPDSEDSGAESGTGRKTEPQGTGSEPNQDLLGGNTATKQAIADAERAKDAKRNSGNDNQDTFTLSGSDSEFEQTRVAGVQDLISVPQAENDSSTFIKSPDGSIDFGEITPEIAKSSLM